MKKLIFLFLIFIACDNGVLGPVAVLDEPFLLEFGEKKVVLPDKLRVEFERLITDSRCPMDARCFVEGHAEISLSLVTTVAMSAKINLKIGDYVTKDDVQAHQSVDRFGYRITLMQLDPYPGFNGHGEPSDYRALLKISKVE